jgi:hypothetical protein
MWFLIPGYGRLQVVEAVAAAVASLSRSLLVLRLNLILEEGLWAPIVGVSDVS